MSPRRTDPVEQRPGDKVGAGSPSGQDRFHEQCVRRTGQPLVAADAGCARLKHSRPDECPPPAFAEQ